MNKVSVILALLLAAMAFSSCDFFRHLAGRPDSAQIAQKRELIEQADARKAFLRDSVEAVRLAEERYVADSLYALDTLRRAGRLNQSSKIKSIPRKNLEYRYYIVAGAFSKPENAEKLCNRYRDAGFEAIPFRYYGSITAVFVAPGNRIPEALEAYRRIQKLPFASTHEWILVDE